MCTYVTEGIAATGSGKGASGWFALATATVYYDHPVHAQAEHSLNIDFANPARGAGERVAVELTTETAVALLGAISGVLAQVPGDLTGVDPGAAGRVADAVRELATTARSVPA